MSHLSKRRITVRQSTACSGSGAGEEEEGGGGDHLEL